MNNPVAKLLAKKAWNYAITKDEILSPASENDPNLFKFRDLSELAQNLQRHHIAITIPSDEYSLFYHGELLTFSTAEELIEKINDAGGQAGMMPDGSGYYVDLQYNYLGRFTF
jgi:hypothetical protein